MNAHSDTLSILLAILFAGTFLLAFALLVRTTARDARNRGKSPVLVTLLVLLSFPLGLIVWLLFRPEPMDSQSPPFRLKDYRVQ